MTPELLKADDVRALFADWCKSDQLFETLLSRVDALPDATPAPSGWQPISSAPDDGTEVVLLTRGGSVVRASYENIGDETWTWVAVNEDEHPRDWDDGSCWELNSDDEPSDQPTHWMPLPAPPAPSGCTATVSGTNTPDVDGYVRTLHFYQRGPGDPPGNGYVWTCVECAALRGQPHDVTCSRFQPWPPAVAIPAVSAVEGCLVPSASEQGSPSVALTARVTARLTDTQLNEWLHEANKAGSDTDDGRWEPIGAAEDLRERFLLAVAPELQDAERRLADLTQENEQMRRSLEGDGQVYEGTRQDWIDRAFGAERRLREAEAEKQLLREALEQIAEAAENCLQMARGPVAHLIAAKTHVVGLAGFADEARITAVAALADPQAQGRETP